MGQFNHPRIVQLGRNQFAINRKAIRKDEQIRQIGKCFCKSKTADKRIGISARYNAHAVFRAVADGQEKSLPYGEAVGVGELVIINNGIRAGIMGSCNRIHAVAGLNNIYSHKVSCLWKNGINTDTDTKILCGMWWN